MELIEIRQRTIGEEQVNSVDARELHEFLGSKQEFAHWIKTKVIANPFFTINQDFILLDNSLMQNGRGGHNRKDYALTIDTAKKVAMSEQTTKGEEIRVYFLQCERRAKQAIAMIPNFSDPAAAARAWAFEFEQKKALEAQARIDAPRVEFAKAIEGTTEKISIGAFAKLTGKIGRNNLFKKMRENHILMKNNIPYQHFINAGYFEVSESIIKRTARDQIILTTYLTGKGQVWLTRKIEEWLSLPDAWFQESGSGMPTHMERAGSAP